MNVVAASDTRNAIATGDSLGIVSFIDTIPWPALAVDPRGTVIAMNRAMRERRGPQGLAAGRKLEELFPDYVAALRGNPPWLAPQEAEVSREHEDGPLHERITVSPMPGGAFVFVEDISRLRELETTDARTARLASLGFMLAGACHEISNPLTAIYSMLQLLQASPHARAPELQKGLAHIGRDVHRLLEIAQRLSGFSRGGEVSRSVFPADESVEESLLLLRQSGQLEGIELAHEPDAQAVVEGSPGQLREVFHNIALNAIQAMEGGGRLLVRTSRAAGQVSVTFHDTGPGVPAKLLDRIFEPFFTTKPQGKGTGLGLSISNEIVHQHGGRIRVENDAAGGARFIVELPSAKGRK